MTFKSDVLGAVQAGHGKVQAIAEYLDILDETGNNAISDMLRELQAKGKVHATTAGWRAFVSTANVR